ncbi:MAG TPA: hypothetical protein ENG33_04040, partial [Chloroflexi bacterium]|nr:hypothetical protein [Chloroflexota bacterium]
PTPTPVPPTPTPQPTPAVTPPFLPVTGWGGPSPVFLTVVLFGLISIAGALLFSLKGSHR